MGTTGNIVRNATSIRKTNRPEQTISVVGDDGLICLYDIQLD